MALEAGTYISDLNQSNPVGATDPKSQGDDHIRLIKTVLKNTLPNGGRAWYIPDASAKTGVYSVVAADESKLITADATGGAFQITLPVTLISTGMALRIVKIDASANAVTIAPSSGNINGAASLTLTRQFSAVECVWNGSTWYAFRSVVAGFEGNQNITGNLDVDGTLNVDGASTLAALTTSGALIANGTAEFNQDVQFDGPVIVTESLLADAATIAWDMDTTAPNVRIVLGASRTLGAATNLKLGQKGHLLVVQDGTGDWSLTLNALYKQPGGATICDVDKTANSETLFDYEVVTDSAAAVVVKLTRRYSEAKNSIGFYKDYTIGINATGVVRTQAHGLGRHPSFVNFYIENTSTELGYSVGERVSIPSPTTVDSGGGGNINGFNLSHDTTNCYVVLGNAIAIHRRSAPIGDIESIDTTKWTGILRVYD